MTENTTDPRFHTSTFVDEMFAGIEPDSGLYALLWTLPDKKSTWIPADDTDAIVDAAQNLSDANRDVYVGVSLAPSLPPLGVRDSKRIGNDFSAGIFGLWADIDVADPEIHKKSNLPATIEEAQWVLEQSGLEPTIIVHSGHGLQAWWLFKEFWPFDGEDDRLRAAGLAQRWNTTLAVRAAAHTDKDGNEQPLVVDRTHDLARIMRMPGTWNRKKEPHMPVQVLQVSGKRYDAEDFEEHCVDQKYLVDRGMVATRSYQIGDLELTEALQVDMEKFEIACDNLEKFRDTWDRKRKDFSDQSGSIYDMSLASQAAQIGWTDQEIAALIVAFRRKHKLDVSKALRQDYIARTIGNARDKQARESTAEVMEDVHAALEAAKTSGDQEEQDAAHRHAMDLISAQLGLEITRVLRYASDPPTFYLVTVTQQRVNLGNVDGILVYQKFRSSVYETLGHLVPRFKPDQWDALCVLITRVWEEQDIGYEATSSGEVDGWLTRFLESMPATTELMEAIEAEFPFSTADGRIHIFLPSFRKFLWQAYGERVTAKAIGARLKSFGAEPSKLDYYKGKTRTSKHTFLLPASYRAE